MTSPRIYATYILASQRNGTLYVGITGDLVNRVAQHRSGAVDGFTKTYRVHILVYYEYSDNPATAILREKHLKHWNRSWKIRLIEKHNPYWKDLFSDGQILPLPVE